MNFYMDSLLLLLFFIFYFAFSIQKIKNVEFSHNGVDEFNSWSNVTLWADLLIFLLTRQVLPLSASALLRPRPLKFLSLFRLGGCNGEYGRDGVGDFGTLVAARVLDGRGLSYKEKFM